MNECVQTWEDLILHHSAMSKYKSRTCCIFNDQSTSPDELDKLCPCERMIRRHSYTGKCVELKAEADANVKPQVPTKFHDMKHSISVAFSVFGTLKSTGCKFLRIDTRIPVKDIFQLISKDCGGQKPALILSVYGGAKYFTMTDRLEKEFIRGIIDAATMADAWILTAGINNGVSKLVGEGISHYRLLREYPNKVKCIGMTMWGTVNENARLELKSASFAKPLCERQIPEDAQEDRENIEPNHTHCILLDGGKLNEYLSDSQRAQFVKEACQNTDDSQTCYAVTIIVEGGFGSLEVLENEIKEERPIVLIQGSGRLADVLASLVEQTSNLDRNQNWSPSTQEIQQALDRFYPSNPNENVSSEIKRIQKILKDDHRHLLHVFSLDRDKNVAETIFKAIFASKNKKRTVIIAETTEDEALNLAKQRRKDEDKLVDLALEWNYFDGVLPILKARQDEMARKKHNFIKEDIERQKELFRKSLEKNRSIFIEYFLSAGFDPLTLAEREDVHDLRKILVDLYSKSYSEMNKSHKERVKVLFGVLPLRSIKELDYRLNKRVGPFFGLIYSSADDNLKIRLKIDLTNHLCTCCKQYKAKENDYDIENNRNRRNLIENKYTKHEILRDLFLWSIFMDMPEMAKVLLLHVRSRICAALIASALFKKYSESSPTIDMKEKFEQQTLEFETYAAMSLNKCDEYNEKRACELLLRQIPLFGNVTCMQVAIASENAKLLETACFDRTLNQVWFDKLHLTNHQLSAKFVQLPCILTAGLLAPVFLRYRDEEKDSLNNVGDEPLSQEGIDYYPPKLPPDQSTWKTYRTHFRYFHTNPMIKMTFHFLSYIFFLLVFSYMMLYHLDGRNTFVIPHWTEIYVIITISTMFCEEIRKIYLDYHRRMVERWGSTGSSIVTVLSNAFYILPYLLFYLGLGFRYASYNDSLLSTARIIWALDLELWYLRSLKFVIALKFLGPKLFMLKNMLRDLFAFVYMIFIAIAAYGVVSRALILYDQVPFTGRGIFDAIFYEPYWFIYGDVSDKTLLDQLISNGTTVAEATATHVLLAFHMLFINILLLNLLIAVFADSIGKVQANTEFYWRYQRYSFVREYFERLPLGYPPLIIIPHCILLILFLYRKCCVKLFRNQVYDANHVEISKMNTPIFKMIPVTQSQNEQWDLFENAATHSYARSVLEKYKNKDSSSVNDEISRKNMTINDSNVAQTTSDQRQTVDNIKDELLSAFKTLLMDTQKALEQNDSRLEKRLDQVVEVITRGKVSDSK